MKFRTARPPLPFAGAVLLAAAGPGIAQTQPSLYINVTESHYQGESVLACMDAAAGDADGDGSVDLALAIEFGPNLLLRNDGSGKLTPADSSLPITRHASRAVSFADVDGDGDLDLIFVSADGQPNELYLNDGSGTFSDASERLPGAGTSNALVTTDIDGDGDIDILIGNIGLNQMLINDGHGNFTDRTSAMWPRTESRTRDLEAVDINGDGHVDIVEANEGPNRIYINDGRGNLSRVNAMLPPVEDESRAVESADLNGDGLPDLMVANVQLIFSWQPHDHILFQDPDKLFRRGDNDHPAFQQDHFTVAVSDLDRDGDMDLILPHVTLDSPGNYQIMLNNGDGRFAPAAENSIFPGILTGTGSDIEIADFNGDGEDDLFLCNRLTPQILLFYR